MCSDTGGTSCNQCTCELVLSGRTNPASPIMTQGGSCWTSNAEEVPGRSERGDSGCHPLSQCIQAGYRSVALVPIRMRDQIVGLIHLNDRRQGRFTLEMVEILEGVAWQVGEALLREQTETLLKEATRLLQKTSRIAKIGGWELDVASREVTWTRETCAIHEVEEGYTPRVDTGLAFYPKETRQFIESAINNAIETGESFDVEVPFVTAKERSLWVKVTGEAEFEGGKCARLSGTFQDITQRKRAEEKLTLLRAAIEQSAETVVITDLTGKIEYVNPAFEKSTGYSSADMIGKSTGLLKSGKQDAAFYQNLWGTISSGHSWRGEFHNRRKDGSLFWESATISPVLDRFGQILHFIAVKEDITERKELEAALGEAVIAAEAGNRVKTEFLSTMSHELRTPLNGVLGFAELLGYTPLDEEQKSFVETIVSSGEHLLSIVNDILDFTSIESDSTDVEIAPLEVAGLLGFLESREQIMAAEKGLEFRTEVAADVPKEILGNERRIGQILINLLNNAIKFTSAGSIVLRVRVSRHDSCSALEFSVEDTGVGMSDETIASLFTPFLQADSKLTRDFGGTGIGLAVAQRLAKRMRGEIFAVSKLGKGSQFILQLPLEIPKSKVASCDQPARDAATSGRKPSTQSERIVLVVEDDQDNRRLAGKMLESLGYSVEFGADGSDALRKFVPGKFFAILMDLQMPVMNGLDAAKRIREIESSSRVPIVAVTANVMPGTSDSCLAYGMDDFLSKPFNRDELQATLARLE